MKRIFSIILCVAMLLSTVVYAKAPGTDNTDVLIDLGLIDDIDADATLTREKFSKSILTAYGVIGAGFGETDEEALSRMAVSSFAEMAIKMGFLNYTDEGDAASDDYVTKGDVMKSVTMLLGYDLMLNAQKAPRIEYINKAYALGLAKETPEKSPVSEGEYASILLKCFDTPIMISEYIDNSWMYVVEEDINFLNERCNIYAGKGQIIANDTTTFAGTTPLNEGYVMIGEDTYNIGDTEAKLLMGYFVEFYYVEGEDENLLLWVYADSEKNKELFIKSDDIVRFENSECYYINENGREKRADIASGAYYIYNQKVELPSDIPSLKPVNGEVTLIDANRDGEYDTVIIMDYDVAFVDSVNADKNFLYTDGIKKNIYELEKYNNVLIFNEEFEKISLGKLEQYDVLWIAESIDKTAVTLIVSTETVSGTVTGIGRDEEERKTITLDNKNTYTIAYDSLKMPALGDMCELNLDVEHRVVRVVKKGSNGYTIGYLIASYMSDEEEKGYLRVYEGSEKRIPLTEKVKFNGTRTPVEDIVNYFRDTENGGYKRQIVRYKKNAKDEIIDVQVAAASESEALENQIFVEGTVASNIANDRDKVWFTQSAGNKFGNYFALADDCVAIIIPSDPENISKYVYGGPDLFGDRWYDGLTAYKVDSNDDKCAAVIWNTTVEGGAKSDTTQLSVVRNINIAITDDDEIGWEIQYYDLSIAPATITEKTAFTKDENYKDLIESLNPGDIIRISVDSGKTVTGLTRVYDKDNEDLMSPGETGWTSNYRGASGKVTKIQNNSMKVKNEKSAHAYVPQELVLFDNSAIYVVESKKNGKIDIYKGTKSDISVDSRVFYVTRVAKEFRIIVFK